MKRGTKDAMWTIGVAVTVTGLITWREWSKQRDREKSKFPEIFSAPEPIETSSRDNARGRGEYR